MHEIYREIVKSGMLISLHRRLFIQKKLSGSSLHGSQMPMVEYIASNEGCTQQEIAEHMRVSPASVALSIKRLCRAGLIIKKTDENNLRCNKVFITDACRSELRNARIIFEDADVVTFKGFSEKELDELYGYMARLLKNISGKEPSDFPLYFLVNKEDETDRRMK